MKLSAALLALVLAGCATTRAPPADGDWVLQASATSGSALVRSDPAGRDQLRIACRRNPSDLYVASDASAASTGAVSLQVDDRAFLLVASTDEPRLAAAGAIPAGLPAALMSARSISLGHAGGRIGPYPAPDAKTAAAFVISCRG